ncbi:MAG: DUF1553 domain-containing protein, partial [Planctomycetota bacterium]
LIREMMLSRTFRLSTEASVSSLAVDPENRLLWRANRQRLDAEVIRDSVLSVSGSLDLEAGGLTIRKIQEYDLGYEFDTVRRSVYVPAFRNTMLDVFEVFDIANPNLVTGNRTTTTLPTQSLFMMNSPFVIEQSRNAAKRLLLMESSDEHERLDIAFQRTLGRLPSNGERALTLEFLDQFDHDDPEQVLDAWSGVFHTLFASLDFRYMN